MNNKIEFGTATFQQLTETRGLLVFSVNGVEIAAERIERCRRVQDLYELAFKAAEVKALCHGVRLERFICI